MGSAAGHHSVHSQATENSEVSSSKSDSSQDEGVGAEEEDNTKEGKSGIKTSSNEQEASDGEDKQECPHTQDTLTGVSQLLSKHEDTDPKSDSREKVQISQQKQRKDSPKKDSHGSSSSEEELPANEVLRDRARQKVWLLDTCFDAWHCDKIANNVTGWVTQDTMTFQNMARHNPTTLTPWGHLWITWWSAKSLTAYGQTSMTYVTSMP